MKNFIFLTFLILVSIIWYLLSIDYFNLYEKNHLTVSSRDSSNKNVEAKELIFQYSTSNQSTISIHKLLENIDKIKNLPFNGFVVSGDKFTNQIMKDREVSYIDLLQELQPLEELNRYNKNIFLLVNIDFPADFWNVDSWNRVTKNFSNLARVTKELNFKGLVLDTNPKNNSDYKMTNFKFPPQRSIDKNLTIYENWEIMGAREYKSYRGGYRNRNYNFEEHKKRVIQLFRKIMVSISTNYPDITLLVYSGINVNQNKKVPNLYQQALFLGLQRGAKENSVIYDMAYIKSIREVYFQNSYFWRKYGVVEDRYNSELNESWEWKIPKMDRERWIKRVKVGFIINTSRIKGSNKLLSVIKRAMKYSDKYVVLFSKDGYWLNSKSRYRDTLKKKIEKVLNCD